MGEETLPSIDEFLGGKKATIADHVRNVADAMLSSRPHHFSLPPLDSSDRAPAESALLTIYQHNEYTDIYAMGFNDKIVAREWNIHFNGIREWAGYLKKAGEVVRGIQKGNQPKNSRERELYRSRHLNGALVMGAKIAVYDRLVRFGELALAQGARHEFYPFEQLNLFDLAGETLFKRRGVNFQMIREMPDDSSSNLRIFQFVADCLSAYGMETYDPFIEENRSIIAEKFPVLTREKVRIMCNLLINMITVPEDDLIQFGDSFSHQDKCAAREATVVKRRIAAAASTVFHILQLPDSPFFSAVRALFEPHMDNPFAFKLLLLPIVGLQDQERVRALYKVSEDYTGLGVYPEFYVRISQCMTDIAHAEGRKQGMFTIRDLPFLYDHEYEPDMSRIPDAEHLQQLAQQIAQLSSRREHQILDLSKITWGGIRPPNKVTVVLPEPGKAAVQLFYPDGEDTTVFQFQMDVEKKENQWWFLETPSHHVDLDKLYIDLQAASGEVLTALCQHLESEAAQRDTLHAAALAPRITDHVAKPNIRVAKANGANGNGQTKGIEDNQATIARSDDVTEPQSQAGNYHILRPSRELLRGIPRKFARQIYTAIDERNRGVDRNFKAIGTMRDICVYEIKSGKYRIILVPCQDNVTQGHQNLRVFDIVLRNDMDSDKFMDKMYERIKREQA